MAYRDRPYSQFNFTVEAEIGDRGGESGGFQEVSGLGLEINVAEYRAGKRSDNGPDKIHGTFKVPDVTLKRGVMRDDVLFDWLKEVRNGAQVDAYRTVTINLLGEDRGDPVQSWTLSNARPIKYTGPALNGKGTDVAVEELVLACERIEMES